jgi:hypothetical protein
VTIDGSGALTLGGSSVDVDADGGTLSLDGSTGLNIGTNADQPIDMDASTLDIDVSGAITIDATTTTFAGKVVGPNATADNEFATYYQLDSLSEKAPFSEMLRYYKLYNGSTFAAQAVSVGSTAQVSLTSLGVFTEESYAVSSPTIPGDFPYSLQYATTPGTDDYVLLADPGIYEVKLTMELRNPNASDAFVNVSILNYDAAEAVYPSTTRTLVTESEVIYGTAHAFANQSSHVNLSMVFEANNSNEWIYIEASPFGAGVEIRTFGFAISRVGEQ